MGCGDAIVFKDRGYHIGKYYGVEANGDFVLSLSNRYPQVFFVQMNLDNDPLGLGVKFDVILMIAIIEHIWNQKFLFEQILNHLKPDGKIVITTPPPFGNDIVHPLGAKLGFFSKSVVGFLRKEILTLLHKQ